ncbi:aminopeptidase [Limibacter armeniacum]|uniref:aminopeptidase n=1 Tax=Limibacter armeniacum TaxID=466084 RepID=UPI002FE5DFA6
MKYTGSIIKRILWGIAAVVIVFLVWNYKAVIYGIQQGKGQLNVIMNAEPIDKFLNDENFPEEKKEKLRLIQEIRQFTVDSIGLNKSGSYTEMYDQKGEPLLWTVTACKPFALEAKEWTFPLVGSFSYKGFFDKELVKQEAEKLKQDWDIRIGQVSAWSTLGVLNDPVLSSMLDRSVGSLTQLIIHELTHGTLYVKNSVTYNENLADFVGDEGAKMFLLHKFGKESKEYQEYMYREGDSQAFSAYILASTQRLDSLYKSFDEGTAVAVKQQKKDAMIKQICEGIQDVEFNNKAYYKYFDNFTPNNTFFMGYKRYREKQNQFKEEFETKFNSDFPAYFTYLKENYKPLLPSFGI